MEDQWTHILNSREMNYYRLTIIGTTDYGSSMFHAVLYQINHQNHSSRGTSKGHTKNSIRASSIGPSWKGSRSKINIFTFHISMCNIYCSIHWTYPFENEQYKGKHHRRILAVVHANSVIVIFLPFPCPWSPSTEDYHGSPDGHRKLDYERDHKTDPQNELTGVALSVAHNLTQSVDDCGDV